MSGRLLLSLGGLCVAPFNFQHLDESDEGHGASVQGHQKNRPREFF